jgi:VWFA-related protein
MFRLMRSSLGPFLAALWLLTGMGWSQSQTAKIQVGVNLVPLAVRVTDRRGISVQGLDAKDFEILENGRQQNISFFSAGNQPVSMTILLDASSSMNSSGKLQPARAMLAQLLDRSHPQDEIYLMPFTDQAGPIQLLTREQLSSPSIIQLAPQRGGTALYDAIAVALCRLRSSANLQQEVVVITDGADQHSRIGLESLIRLVQASRAQLFMVGFFSPSELQLYRSGDKSVILYTGREIDNPIVAFDRLAKESGAEAFFPTSQNALKQALEAIAGTLESQYLLAYYPQVESAGFRKVEVKVHRHGLTVRARRGVEMEPPSANTPVHFLPGSCAISPEAHPYPYELHLTQNHDSLLYKDNFSDPRSGWPDRKGSKYTSAGYELSFDNSPQSRQPGEKIFFNLSPIGEGVLAAYGTWWQDFRASVLVDANWPKLEGSSPTSPRSPTVNAYSSAAGLVFRMNDGGFYAFLLSTSGRGTTLWFKLVSKTYSGAYTDIVPWTEIPELESARSGLPQERASSPKKISVECVGGNISLFVGEQKVASLRDETFGNGYVGMALFGNGRAIFRDLVVQSLK